MDLCLTGKDLQERNGIGCLSFKKNLWKGVVAGPARPRRGMIFFLFIFLFKKRKRRERNQKRHLFFSLFRLLHRRVFGSRWRTEIVFISLFSLKIPLFEGFFRAVAVFFSYKRAGGKVVFFHFVQGVRVQKSLMPRGSAAQGFVVYYDIFSLFFPSYLRSRRSAGVSFWGSTGVGGDIVFFALQGKYNIAILLGQATPGIFPGVSTINTFNIPLAISIPYFSNNPLFSPFSDHSTQTLWQV